MQFDWSFIFQSVMAASMVGAAAGLGRVVLSVGEIDAANKAHELLDSERFANINATLTEIREDLRQDIRETRDIREDLREDIREVRLACPLARDNDAGFCPAQRPKSERNEATDEGI